MIRHILMAAALVATYAPTASAGTGSAEFLASVRATGAIVRGSGVTSSVKTATGRYEVQFSRDISACYYFVSPISGGALKAVASVSSRSPQTMLVKTFLNASTAQDVAFNVIVRCQD